VSTLAFPKPKDMPKLPPAAVLYPEGEGGREVCNMKSAAGRAEYERRKDVMYARQKNRCSLCGNLMDRENATFEHEDGRGMGGSRQDDRIWKLDPVTGELKPYNSAAHGWCNGKKGSQRMEAFESLSAAKCGVGRKWSKPPKRRD
jgi:hypothetical protein